MLEILHSGGQSEEQARQIRIQLGIESSNNDIRGQFGTMSTTSSTQQDTSHSSIPAVQLPISSIATTHRPGSKIVLLRWNPKKYPSIYSATTLEQHLYIYGEVESVLFGRDGHTNNGTALVEFRTEEGAETCFDGIKQRKEKELRGDQRDKLDSDGIMDVDWPTVSLFFFIN